MCPPINLDSCSLSDLLSSPVSILTGFFFDFFQIFLHVDCHFFPRFPVWLKGTVQPKKSWPGEILQNLIRVVAEVGQVCSQSLDVFFRFWRGFLDFWNFVFFWLNGGGIFPGYLKRSLNLKCLSRKSSQWPGWRPWASWILNQKFKIVARLFRFFWKPNVFVFSEIFGKRKKLLTAICPIP